MIPLLNDINNIPDKGKFSKIPWKAIQVIEYSPLVKMFDPILILWRKWYHKLTLNLTWLVEFWGSCPFYKTHLLVPFRNYCKSEKLNRIFWLHVETALKQHSGICVIATLFPNSAPTWLCPRSPFPQSLLPYTTSSSTHVNARLFSH